MRRMHEGVPAFINGAVNPTDGWHWMTYTGRLAYCPDKIIYVFYPLNAGLGTPAVVGAWLTDMEGGESTVLHLEAGNGC